MGWWYFLEDQSPRSFLSVSVGYAPWPVTNGWYRIASSSESSSSSKLEFDDDELEESMDTVIATFTNDLREAGGLLTRYSLTSTEIRRETAEATVTLALAEIDAIQLGTFQRMAFCKVRSAAGEMDVMCGHPGTPPPLDEKEGYLRFVTELHSTLAEQDASPSLTYGSWFLVGVHVFIVTLCLCVGAVLWWYFDVTTLAVLVICGFGLVSLPFTLLFRRPRTYSLDSIPASALRF